MASGNTMAIFTPLNNFPPTSNYATLDTRNNHLVLDFDPTTAESAVFDGVMPENYAGSGLTVIVVWSVTGATAGNCVWGASFERMGDEDLDVDSDSFATEATATGAAPATDGMLQYTSITLTNGAGIDSVVAGDAYRLKIRRVATDGSDTINANDVELHRVHVKET